MKQSYFFGKMIYLPSQTSNPKALSKTGLEGCVSQNLPKKSSLLIGWLGNGTIGTLISSGCSCFDEQVPMFRETSIKKGPLLGSVLILKGGVVEMYSNSILF